MSPTLRIIAPNEDCRPGARTKPWRIALLGNYPPRRCGIATFTADVRDALITADPNLICDVYAMTDQDRNYAYPSEVVQDLRADRVADYLDAAERINQDQPDVVCVQHEFGIFGGPAGEHLMRLLEATARPVVTTLHTVLESPDPDQRRVFERLIARSDTLTVMAERGRDMLRQVWRVPEAKIVLIPHGAPDRPLSDTAPFKAKLGLAGRDVLFTFGLISPNKGIEYAIRAMPAIVARRPNAIYVVLGASHPNLIAQEGERYREGLAELADNLGVADHIRLIDEYADTARLIEYLQAADVYVTPYLSRHQVTSGTLSYAAALGKPIISTPYWHAEELLKDGLGRLIPFASAEAISREAITLLDDHTHRLGLARRIYDASRETVWSCFGVRLLDVFERAATAAPRPPQLAARPANGSTAAPSLDAVVRLTDSCGILQHGIFGVPDRAHGYCVDDNARALILMHQWPEAANSGQQALAETYAAFLQHAWNDDAGRFRNFMGYDRRWCEPVGSEDSTGRAVWAVAVSAIGARRPDHRRWASGLIDRVLPHLSDLRSPRAEAFILIGLCAMIDAHWPDERVEALAREKADRLVRLFDASASVAAPWFESILAYDNARLPEALIRAGVVLKRKSSLDRGLQSLAWLCKRQTDDLGRFLPVATVDFGRPLNARGLFDQQPLEACATIGACEAAFAATGDTRWVDEADRAFAWYFGGNILGVDLATGDGGCYDGLTWAGANENQGAESVLSFQLAACAFDRLTARRGVRVKTASDV